MRTKVTLAEIADWSNLVAAVERAQRGKRFSPEVLAFHAGMDSRLAEMREGILNGSVVVGECTRFHIRDPKPRIIHAPSFRERVLHHAIIARVGPVLERSLVDDAFACRVGKGTLAAVRRTQQHVRRFPWYAKLDIRGYFASTAARSESPFADIGYTPGRSCWPDRAESAFGCVWNAGNRRIGRSESTPANSNAAPTRRWGFWRTLDRRRGGGGKSLVALTDWMTFKYHNPGELVESGARRVIRGGSWNYDARNVRAANRNANHAGNWNNDLGFRCLSSRGRE